MKPETEKGFSAFQTAMLIKEIYSLMTRDIDCSLLDSGLTNQQTMVIKLLAHKGELTISALCEEMSLTKGTVSGIVSRLENLELIQKQKHRGDQRTTFVVLSEKGLRYAMEYRDLMNNSFQSVFRNFSESELSVAKDQLTALRDRMKEKAL